MKNLKLLYRSGLALVLLSAITSAVRGTDSCYAHGTCEDTTEQKHYLAPLQWYSNVAYNAFGNDYQDVPLARYVFCKDFTIQDVFLLANLSNSNLMRNADIPANPPVRPGGNTAPFGNFQSDQYLSHLAPVNVNIVAEQREENANIGLSYRRAMCDSECTFYSIGFNIPIVSALHLMDLHFSNGDLAFENLPLGLGISQTVLGQFFNDFIDMRDFFDRAVLQPKGLTFLERQRKIGVGDISLYGTVEKVGVNQYLDVAQAGLNLVLPSGNKQQGDTVWEIELGNGGAVQLEASLALFFSTPSSWVNPVVRLAGQVSPPFTALRRIPALRQQLSSPRILITSFNDLIDPIATFRGNYYVDTFEKFDSSVPYFSDLAVKARIRYGARFLISVGNYFYNVFNSGFRFGVFYDFMHKSRDKVCAIDNSHLFNNGLIEARTQQKFHRFGWNLSRVCCDSNVEISVGSQHIFAGRNVAKTQEAFVSLTVAF